MSNDGSSPLYPVRLFDVAVRSVADLTPHFRRITFAGPALARFGVPGPVLDLRIKLLLPVPGQPLSRPGGPDGTLYEGWYQDWLRLEQPGRGWIRSYTVRALRTTDHGRELDVDFVLHPHTGGAGAPASDWARAAAPGVGAMFIGPDAGAITGATSPSETGIRWNPRGAQRLLLAGDETAVPAISSILETLPAEVTGTAFLEVGDGRDFQDISTASQVDITWLARNPVNAGRGWLLAEAVRRLGPESLVGAAGAAGPADQREGSQELYAWVAAEAGTVRNLRRYLVDQLGLDPKRSELRAYWSLGKAGSGTKGVPVGQELSIG